jgi:HSF-type DNA-binding
MCVTNTTHRRIQAVMLNTNQLQVSPSVLSQRLLGSFPLAQLPATSSSSSSACGGSLVATATSAGCDFPLQYSVFSSSAVQHDSAKTRPKRRRKPQKPGKTAKLNDRHFVVHNYHDHSHDPDDADDGEDQSSSYDDHQHHSSFDHADEARRRGGVAVAFPLKLHAVLDQVERDGYSHVISWSPHGRCFVIHQPKQFTEEVMPKYVERLVDWFCAVDSSNE